MRATAVVTVMVLICLSVVHFTQRKSPAIRCGASVVEFQDLRPGVRTTKTVELFNEGREDLRISSVKAGCGCTETSLAVSRIPPKSSVSMRVSMKLRGKEIERGKATPIYIFANDPAKPRIGSQRSPRDNTASRKRSIDFGEVKRENLPVTRALAVVPRLSWRASTEKDLTAIGVRVVSGRPLSGKARIRVDREAPSGEVFTKLPVSHSRNGFEEILVRANIAGACYAIPSMIAVGPIYESDDEHQRHVEFVADDLSLYPKDVAIEYRSKVFGDCLKCRTVDGPDALGAVFTFAPTDDFVWQSKRILGVAVFRISLDDGPSAARVAVPISLTVRTPSVRGN